MTSGLSDGQFVLDEFLGRSDELRDLLIARMEAMLSSNEHWAGLGNPVNATGSVDDAGIAIAIARTGAEAGIEASRYPGGKAQARAMVGGKDKAEAVRSGAKNVFSANVYERRSSTETRAYLSASLVGLRDDMRVDLKRAVLEDLGQAR